MSGFSMSSCPVDLSDCKGAGPNAGGQLYTLAFDHGQTLDPKEVHNAIERGLTRERVVLLRAVNVPAFITSLFTIITANRGYTLAVYEPSLDGFVVSNSPDGRYSGSVFPQASMTFVL